MHHRSIVSLVRTYSFGAYSSAPIAHSSNRLVRRVARLICRTGICALALLICSSFAVHAQEVNFTGNYNFTFTTVELGEEESVQVIKNDQLVLGVEDLPKLDFSTVRTEAVGEAHGKFSLKTDNFKLGYYMSLKGDATVYSRFGGGYTTAGTQVHATYSWRYRDFLSIKAGDSYVLPFDIESLGRGKLKANWEVDGTNTGVVGSNSDHFQYSYASSFEARAGAELTVENLFGVDDFAGLLKFNVDVNSGERMPFNLEGFGTASSLNVLVELNWMNTMRLTSIAFEDGTTPEDLGWTIEFDSGRPSPNLTVPEPAPFCSVLCGVVAVNVVARRRRAAKAGRPGDRAVPRAERSSYLSQR